MIRLATYNIKHGSLKGLGAIARVLQAIGADFTALQEVDQGTSRSGGVDQAAALGREFGWNHIFAPAFAYQGGAYGLALLSPHPIRMIEAIPLPAQGAVSPEPRLLLVCEAHPPQGAPLTLAITHLGLDPRERLQQAHAILGHLSDRPRLLLLGDLNEGRSEAAFGLLEGTFVDTLAEAGAGLLRTYPADPPTIGIDHVLRSADLPPARRAETVSTQASDHLPVVVTLG